MKKWLLAAWLMALPLMGMAQQAAHPSWYFGYFSYDAVLRSMPDYAIAKRNIDDLRAQYDAEMRRAEDDFNKKYEEFLDGQRDYAPAIFQKRQAELEDLLNRNVDFRKQAQRLLAQAETDAYAPLRQRLQEAVKRLGSERGYAFILNTDGDACPYADPQQGEDVTEALQQLLAQ